jgi:hypothetical protein
VSETTKKWKLMGYDPLSDGDSFYGIPGEFDDEAHATNGALDKIAELDSAQKSSGPGGPTTPRDRVYIVSPEGKMRRIG